MFGSSLFHSLMRCEKKVFEVFSFARKYMESVAMSVKTSLSIFFVGGTLVPILGTTYHETSPQWLLLLLMLRYIALIHWSTLYCTDLFVFVWKESWPTIRYSHSWQKVPNHPISWRCLLFNLYRKFLIWWAECKVIAFFSKYSPKCQRKLEVSLAEKANKENLNS